MKKLITLLAIVLLVNNCYSTSTVAIWKLQSNCRGHAPNSLTDTSLTGVMNWAQMWDGTQFSSLHVGVNNQYPTNDTTHGAILEFAKQWHSSYPSDTLYLVMYSIISTPLANNSTLNCWFPTKRGTLFDVSISTENSALSYIWNTLGKRTYNFITILQGTETDCGTLSFTNAVQTNLSNFIHGDSLNISGSAFNSSKKSYIVTQLSSNQTSLNATNKATINTAMTTVASGRSDTYILNTNTQTTLSDHLHYNEAGTITEGTNLISIVTTNNLK